MIRTQWMTVAVAAMVATAGVLANAEGGGWTKCCAANPGQHPWRGRDAQGPRS